MNPKTFENFRDLVYTKSGITLGEQKEALVSARIAKRMRALNIESQEEYYDAVVRDKGGTEIVQLIDAISTNFTSFYREPVHFEILTKLLTRWKKEGQRRFRIWCAAASTGEEPYTLAMTLNEALGGLGLDEDPATDISTRVLQICREGVYDAQRVATVNPELRRKYFHEVRDNGTARFEAHDSLRSLLVFRRLNLSAPPFPMQGPFDAVFCRNVMMIYFDNQVRTRLVGEIYKLLKPGGYLMIGYAESLTGLNTPLKTVRPSVYVK